MNETLVFDFIARQVVLVTPDGERRPADDQIVLVAVPTPSAGTDEPDS